MLTIMYMKRLFGYFNSYDDLVLHVKTNLDLREMYKNETCANCAEFISAVVSLYM